MDIATRVSGAARVRDLVGERCQKKFQDFLEQFINTEGEKLYLEEARQLLNPERNTLFVDYDHVATFDDDLARLITEDYYRVSPFLNTALRNFVVDNEAKMPERKEFYVAFSNIAGKQKVRELNSAKIGSLLCISGQVIRTHPVHPELVSGTFTCVDCNSLITNVEQQFKYSQPTICTNPQCQNRSRFVLDIDKSKFVDFQKVRVQETQAEIPRGSIPRSVEIVLRGEIVESVQPGDKCDFIGTLIVVPDVAQLASSGMGPGAVSDGGARRGKDGYETEGIRGLKSLGVRDLTYRLSFLACNITSSSQLFGGQGLGLNSRDARGEEMTAERIKDSMTEAEWNKVYEMSQDRHLYDNLVASMFPAIHGNDEVKKGVLLMLFGGVPKTTSEGTTLRGDINVCIVGDPSTAKSQVLKRVEQLTPRAVYTSGKASSAAGLTAAVVKDEESFEFVIEAGALMLADNGVCCIDEFDKMDYRDQVAIHEAMEQQTISIAKAGVKATLNARASILAAANPLGGRYDKKKTLKQNINLSAPIMSRFDLFFVLVDECRETLDYAIARKLVNLHCGVAETVDCPYTVEEVQRYIMFARQFKPKISLASQEYMVTEYRRLRQRDCVSGTRSSFRITVRQLESMVRLSEALARMHIVDEVQPKHVKEAFRLLSKSIIRVEQGDVELEDMSCLDTQDDPATQDASKTGAQAASAAGVKIKFEEYRRIMNVLIHRLHQLEEEADMQQTSTAAAAAAAAEGEEEAMETGDAQDLGEMGGAKKSDLIEWYLDQISDEIDSMDQLAEWKTKVDKIINRLVDHEHALIAIEQPSTAAATEAETRPASDPYLVVHPNYNFEE